MDNNQTLLNSDDFLIPAQADIIRCVQKDDYYAAEYLSKFEEVSEIFLGNSFCVRWNAELKLLSNTLYYTLCTLLLNKTLGEEYTDLFPMFNNKKLSVKRRFSTIFLQYTPIYILTKFATSIKFRNHHPKLHSIFSELIDIHVPNFRRFYLAYFFIFGGVFQFSQKILGLEYKFLSNVTRKKFRNLTMAAILLLHSLFIFWQMNNTKKENKIIDSIQSVEAQNDNLTINQIKENIKKKKKGYEQYYNILSKLEPANNQSHNNNIINENNFICIFCASQSDLPSCSPCGHIFCWNCILQWLNINQYCPVCRAGCLPQQILRIHHWTGLKS